MNDFDKIILNGFRLYLEKHNIDIHDPVSLRQAGAAYGDELMGKVIDFIEWSIQDDCNNNLEHDAQ